MNFRCNDCRTVTWVPTTSAWPSLCPKCGAMNWMAVGGEVPIGASGGYVPTEADALRAEVAVLKAQLATYIALRDRLIAWQHLPAYGEGAFKMLQDEMDAIIKRAQELAQPTRE